MPRTRTPRDLRRRSMGQNFLISQKAIRTLLEYLGPEPDDLIVELAAGRGALTIPLARRGARVIAVERDPVWVRHLEQAVADAGVEHRVTITLGDLRSVAFPSDTYRVVAAPPFNLTTALLSRLLDDPASGPWRADLLLQYEVARKGLRQCRPT